MEVMVNATSKTDKHQTSWSHMKGFFASIHSNFENLQFLYYPLNKMKPVLIEVRKLKVLFQENKVENAGRKPYMK